MSKSAIFLKGDETTINQSIGNNRKKTLGAQNCLHFKVIIPVLWKIYHIWAKHKLMKLYQCKKKRDQIIYIAHYKSQDLVWFNLLPVFNVR